MKPAGGSWQGPLGQQGVQSSQFLPVSWTLQPGSWCGGGGLGGGAGEAHLGTLWPPLRCGGPAWLPTTQPQGSGEPPPHRCPASAPSACPHRGKGRSGGGAPREPRTRPSCFQGGLETPARPRLPPPARPGPHLQPAGTIRRGPNHVAETQLTFFPVHHRQYFENYSKITQKMKSKSIQNTNSTFL